MSYCANDMAARQHATAEGELAAQEQAIEQELERMKRDRHPSLIVALDNALIDVIDTACIPLQELFIEQWINGNPLALAIAPEKQIITALMPYWRAQNEN